MIVRLYHIYSEVQTTVSIYRLESTIPTSDCHRGIVLSSLVQPFSFRISKSAISDRRRGFLVKRHLIDLTCLSGFLARLVHPLAHFGVVVGDRLADCDEPLDRHVDRLPDARHRRRPERPDAAMLLHQRGNLQELRCALNTIPLSEWLVNGFFRSLIC